VEKPTESPDAAKAKEPADVDEPAEAPPRPRWRRRAASLLFAAGCFAVLVSIMPAIPQDREVRLYLNSPESVTELSLTFLNPDGEPVRGTKYQFMPGTAERVWTTQVSLPEGDYTIESRVLRGERASEEQHHIVVDGDTLVEIRLR